MVQTKYNKNNRKNSKDVKNSKYGNTKKRNSKNKNSNNKFSNNKKTKYVMNGGNICKLFSKPSMPLNPLNPLNPLKPSIPVIHQSSVSATPATNKNLVYTGIQNLGATCYINATIQMLWSIPEIRTYILSLNYIDIVNSAHTSYANKILLSLTAIFQSFNGSMKTHYGADYNTNRPVREILQNLSSVIHYNDKNKNPEPDISTHQDEFEFLVILFKILETININLSNYLNINIQTIKKCYFPIKDYDEPQAKAEPYTFLDLETYDIYTDEYIKEIIERFKAHKNHNYFKPLKEYKYLSDYKKPTEFTIQILLDNYQKYEIMNDPDSYLSNCLNEDKAKPLKNLNRKGTEQEYFNIGPGYRYKTIKSLSNNLVIFLKRFEYDINGQPRKKIDRITPNKTLNINDIVFKLQGCIISLSNTMQSGHYVYLVFDDNGNPAFIMDDSRKRDPDTTYLTHGYIYYYIRQTPI